MINGYHVHRSMRIRVVVRGPSACASRLNGLRSADCFRHDKLDGARWQLPKLNDIASWPIITCHRRTYLRSPQLRHRAGDTLAAGGAVLC